MANQRGKRWIVPEPAPQSVLARYRGMTPILAQVLYNRGLTTPEDAAQFLAGHDVRHNPFRLADMAKAVSRLRHAIKSAEPIVVYGDFDADGVTATALMVQGLTALGAAHVRPYIPNRVDEGYGLNVAAIDMLYDEGYRLIVTVDCGIRALDEVAHAKRRGIDVIVTDHHSLGPELPEAYAVINCKRPGYDEPMLAGVGVAFKVIDALRRAELNNGGSARAESLDLTQLLDLVAIGTVADLMPLNHLENRSLVRQGLDVLRAAKRPGIKALLEVSGISPESVTTSSIAFGIGPRINAAGRLSDAIDAYKLLSSPTVEAAEPLASLLQRLNVERQEKTRLAQELIRAEIVETFDGPLIFAGHRELESGIVGLVAGRMVEEYFVPSIILEYGDEESRASCRSIPEFDITAALDQCADLLVRHGGHAQAAGFTVRNENLSALRERLRAIAERALAGQDLRPELVADAEVRLADLTLELAYEVQRLEPTGTDNETPLFIARGLHVTDRRRVGRDKSHLRLRLTDGMRFIEAIAFKQGDWDEHMPAEVDVAFHLELNEWNGTIRLQLNVQDIQPAGASRLR